MTSTHQKLRETPITAEGRIDHIILQKDGQTETAKIYTPGGARFNPFYRVYDHQKRLRHTANNYYYARQFAIHILNQTPIQMSVKNLIDIDSTAQKEVEKHLQQIQEAETPKNSEKISFPWVQVSPNLWVLNIRPKSNTLYSASVAVRRTNEDLPFKIGRLIADGTTLMSDKYYSNAYDARAIVENQIYLEEKKKVNKLTKHQEELKTAMTGSINT